MDWSDVLGALVIAGLVFFFWGQPDYHDRLSCKLGTPTEQTYKDCIDQRMIEYGEQPIYQQSYEPEKESKTLDLQ